MATKADARLRIGADTSLAQKALNSLQGDVASLNGTVKSGQERIEKFATAVTGSASVIGGLGSKAGAAAGAVSNLATAFVAGGPLLAGMALATTSAAALASAWKEAEENSKAAAGAFDTLTASMQSTSRTRIQSVRDEIDRLSKSIATFGMGGTEAALFLARGQRGIVGEGIENLEKSVKRAEARKREAGIELAELEQKIELGLSMDVARQTRLKEEFDVQLLTLKSLRDKLEARREETSLMDKQIELLEELEKKEQEAERKRKLRSGKKGRKKEEDLEDEFEKERAAIQKQREEEDKRFQAFLELAAKRRSQALKESFREFDSFKKEEAALEKEKADKIIAEIKRVEQFRNVIAGSDAQIAELEIQLRQFEHVETAKTFLLERELRKRQEQQERYAELGNKVWQESVSFLTSVTQQLFDQMLDVLEDFAAGQKVAFDELAAAFVRQIGTQIFSVGLRTFSEGVALAPTLLLPGGQVNGPAVAAHLGAGTALMATGGAMAASGAVAQGVMRRNASTGGGGGGALGGGALAPRGGTGGGVGDAADREAVVINFNGGTQLGDPTERALTMARDQRRARRTVYMPRGG